MHISFVSHNASLGSSSAGVFNYLEKENELKDKELYEAYMNDLVEEYEVDSELKDHQKFFNQELENPEKEKFFEAEQAYNDIDNNVGSRAKTESNFYMMNISPSKQEMEHLNKIAEKVLQEKGIGIKEKEVLMQTYEGERMLKSMKNDVMHQLLRDYTRDVMKSYAENFERKTYANPDKLPNRKEYSQILKETKVQLEQERISKNDSRFSERKQEILEEKAKAIGKDLSLKNLDERDILWYGKVEEQRIYKHNDKWVIENEKIYKEIQKLNPNTEMEKISALQNKLHRDRVTNQVVRAGLSKGGDQYHVHVVISRHEKNVKDNRLKQSLSPLANHKKGKLAGKDIDVGFNRDNFFQKVERNFDLKFSHQREADKSYNYRNAISKGSQSVSTAGVKVGRSVGNKITSTIGKDVRKEVYRQTGMNEINKLNFKKQIESQIGVRIPLKVPKNALDLSIKISKAIINQVRGAGRTY